MILNAVRKYIAACPYIKGGKVNANYLDEKPAKYTIYNNTGDPIIKKYVDGGTLRQFLFVFAARLPYSENIVENVDSTEFFEKFSGWIESQNEEGRYPALDAGLEPCKVEVLSDGYLHDAGATTAEYQINLRLIYVKNRR